jgi:glycosyltransferase involved in cell wall biosynthesis
MAHRVLSLTRDVTPMNKIIKHQETGFLFETNDDLKIQILNIMKLDNDTETKIQKNALETIENSYSIIQMYSSINKVYKD